MNLEISNAKISSVNIRREKAGDESGDIGVDINIKFLALQEQLKQIASVPGNDQQFQRFKEAYWNDDGDLRIPFLVSVKSSREFIDQLAEIEVPFNDKPLRLKQVRVCKFAIKPVVGGLAEVGLQVQSHPQSSDIATLSELIQTETKICFSDPQGDLLDGEGEAASDE